MSSETKFTPGPWEVNTLAGRPNREVFAGDQGICDCGIYGADNDEIEANARLIAAAPEMYAALRAIDALFAEPLCCLIRKMHGSITNGDQDVIDAAFGKMMHALGKAQQP